MTLEEIETPQPHFIPGYFITMIIIIIFCFHYFCIYSFIGFNKSVFSYTGYCPQFIYRTGDTYGNLTHKLIIDPCISHAENIILSNRNSDDYHVYRPTLREIDLVRDHELEGDPIYKHPVIPGYEGFIPKVNGIFGQRFSIAATEGIANFQREQLKKRCEERKLRHRGVLQSSTITSGRSLGERSVSLYIVYCCYYFILFYYIKSFYS